jgi:hypothetical protein
MEEIWRNIVESDKHQVSNLGRVRSIDSTYWSEHNNGYNKMKGKVLKPTRLDRGYQQIQFKHKGKKHLLHRVVAAAFIPNPNNYHQINHINADPSDNRIENLEWGNQSQNIQHAYNIGTKVPRCKKTK